MNLSIISARYDALAEEIDLFNEMGISAGQKLSGKLKSIQNALDEIKQKVTEEGFTSSAEEIEFFKKWKPLFVARHLFEQEKFKLDLQVPTIDANAQKDYLVGELTFLDQVTAKHQFFYQYFLSDSGELDHFYFLRNVVPPSLIWTGPLDYDRDFGSPGDAIFARFICNGWLREYLLKLLLNAGDHLAIASPLTWTGEKQNLIELAYGLWLTKQINDGNVTLQQIVKWLETSLQVELGSVQKAFANIRSRKRLSPTKYIDQLKDEILKKIDDDFQ